MCTCGCDVVALRVIALLDMVDKRVYSYWLFLSVYFPLTKLALAKGNHPV